MYGPSYYKLDARRMLAGRYAIAVLAAAITLILPAYIDSLLERLILSFEGTALYTAGIIVAKLAFTLFAVNILQVGYYRFLMSYEDPTDAEDPKKPDLNLVVSGFTKRYGNTLKITALKEIFLFGWILVGLAPLLIFTGAAAYMIYASETMSTMYDLFIQATLSPSYDMIMNLTNHILVNCPFLPVAVTFVFFLTIASFIPYIMKSYEYAMIPMIVSDYPDISAAGAFKRTRDIMTGFKLRYFIIQLSFIGYVLVIGLGSSVMGVNLMPIVMIIGMLLIDPYISMTYTRFYKERNSSIEYNISFYESIDVES